MKQIFQLSIPCPSGIHDCHKVLVRGAAIPDGTIDIYSVTIESPTGKRREIRETLDDRQLGEIELLAVDEYLRIGELRAELRELLDLQDAR